MQSLDVDSDVTKGLLESRISYKYFQPNLGDFGSRVTFIDKVTLFDIFIRKRFFWVQFL